MKIIAKSLLSQTGKSKKQDKYSEISSIKQEYKFPLNSKVIYVGMVDEYNGLECVIIKRSRRKSTEYYKIKFDDNEQLDGIASGFIRTLEEYQSELEQLENKCEDDIGDVSETERKILEAGLIPMKNQKSCHNQDKFYHRACGECDKENVCIYDKKYKYDKVKYN